MGRARADRDPGARAGARTTSAATPSCPARCAAQRIERVIEAYAEKNKIDIAEAESYYLQRQASKAYVEPEEIAATILFLASDQAKSLTGQFIGLDGAFD